MRLIADFLIRREPPQGFAANDDRVGEDEFALKNVPSVELTHMLPALPHGDDGA